MTKQHFIAIAEILRRRHASDATIGAFMDYFETVNPNFNRRRFYEAATQPEETTA